MEVCAYGKCVTYVRTCVAMCRGASVGVPMSSYVRTYVHIDHTYCMHVHKSMHMSTHVVLYSSENPMLKRVQHTIVRCLKAFMNNKVGTYICTYVCTYVHAYMSVYTYIRTYIHMYTSTAVQCSCDCLCTVHLHFVVVRVK